ncbi:MAG TPA: hypothetical protein VHO06_19140 [Polyangia bacterium]|nr:hypothetical protein [Polyangia bacterium]
MVKTKLLIATTTIFLGGSVFAQGPAAPETPPPPGAPGGSVDLSVKQRPVLTPVEMTNQAKEYFKGMGDVLKRIQTLQDQAKREKDIIRLNCVTDKLVQARVNVNIAEQSMATLQESIARNDEGEETHDFTRLTIVNQKVTVLGAEAENCIGEDLSFVGATRVDVEVDPNIPQYDPTQPGSPFIDITRPPEASPVD